MALRAPHPCCRLELCASEASLGRNPSLAPLLPQGLSSVLHGGLGCFLGKVCGVKGYFSVELIVWYCCLCSCLFLDELWNPWTRLGLCFLCYPRALALTHSTHPFKWPAFVVFSSVTQSCPTLCDPMDCSTPGLPVHHQVLEFTHNSRPLSRWCHPTIFLSSPSPPTFNLCQHLKLFQIPEMALFQL